MRINRVLLAPIVTLLGIFALALILAATATRGTSQEKHSCSTFLMRAGDALLVGHNLDDNIEVPGMIVVNPRGLSKQNVSWDDIKSTTGPSRSEPRVRWVSKYGSVTYNAMGREFPDGGVNEAGLYVGEMTLMGTRYPKGKAARFYHNQWMQYLLDNFATVEEALSSLSSALPDGHCQWHFFVAEKGGRAAVVEFLDGKSVVYAGDKLPYPILCNDAYGPELEDLRNYAGFGGTKKPEPRYEREDPRFRWAAVMLREYDGTSQPVDYAFSILKRLDLGNNKWSLIYDLTAQRVFVRTYKAGRVRSLEFAGFDFSCQAGARSVDIHGDFTGNVSARLETATDAANARNVAAFWSGVDMGFFGNTFLKKRLVACMTETPSTFTCTP